MKKIKIYNGCGCKIQYKNKQELIDSGMLGGYCNECNKEFCGKHLFNYVDGNNRSITKNSPSLCKEDYQIKYNERK